MSRKPKFKPIVTRVKLNPEQAVLLCTCYNTGVVINGGGSIASYWKPNGNDAACGGKFLDPNYYFNQVVTRPPKWCNDTRANIGLS